MSNAHDELTQVLTEARRLLALPENDLTYSGWSDADEALAEIDSLIATVRGGELPRFTLQALFAPTGPIQETSLSSGWSQSFLALAERFDAALERLERE